MVSTAARRAAVGTARMPTDAVDREFQIGVALFHQLHGGDGEPGCVIDLTGVDFIAALVEHEFECHALCLQAVGDGVRAKIGRPLIVAKGEIRCVAEDLAVSEQIWYSVYALMLSI